MDEAGVDRVVIVPPSWPGDRNDYALEAARRYPNRFAVMGRIALEKPESAALIPKWKEQPGMKGIRLTFQREQAAMLEHADWIFPAAEKADMPIMFFAPGQHAEVCADRRAPSRAAADHRPHEPHQRDRQGAAASPAPSTTSVTLAKYPNVSVKVSSAPNFSKEAYPWRDMTEHIKRCFDAFGPRRCYWGTDLTNSLAKATYRQRIDAFHQGAAVPVRGGQGLGDGQGDPGAVELGLVFHIKHSRIEAGDSHASRFHRARHHGRPHGGQSAEGRLQARRQRSAQGRRRAAHRSRRGLGRHARARSPSSPT